MGAIGIPDDAISSVKISPFVRVILYTDASFRGQSISLTGPRLIPDLSSLTDSGGNWDDRASSLQVISVPPTQDQIASCCLGVSGGSSTDCGKYVAGSLVCTEALRGYCTGTNSQGQVIGTPNMDVPACQSWCKLNPTICDKAAIDYCAGAGTGTPFCTCINSPATTKGLINPKCADRSCISTGYLTTNMQQANCPNIINCTIQANLANSGVEISKTVPIEQNCGNTNTSGTNVGSNPSSTSISTIPGNASSGISMSSGMIALILFIVFLFVVILLGYFAYKTRSSEQKINARRA